MIQELEHRQLSLRPSTLRDSDRSVEAVISTETPVREWDHDRGEMVPRVLLAGGVKFPDSRQIPLIDSHDRTSTKNQIGSVRSLRIEAGQVVGRLVFSSTANDTWQLVREGHLTDVSIGFAVTTETHVGAGTSRTIQERTFRGPVNVATEWFANELSVVVIGADPGAKIMRSELVGARSLQTYQPVANSHDLMTAVRAFKRGQFA